MARPEDVQATFCATLVDEWARDGVEHAVVCPGSRSTPLAVALAADDRITVHVQHDEVALGQVHPDDAVARQSFARERGRPAVTARGEYRIMRA